jgi:hypothetical protein
MMGADEDRVDVQRQRQRQHRIHRAGREGDDRIGETYLGGDRDDGDENGRNDARDRKRAKAGGQMPKSTSASTADGGTR